MKNKLFGLLLSAAFLFMLLNPSLTIQGTRKGLLLWYQSFLPAVFPFMILSSFLTLRLKKGGCLFAVLGGFLNGYPNGAKIAADLRKQGLLSEKYYIYFAVFCNLPGPAFMISFVGLRRELLFLYSGSLILLLTCCILTDCIRYYPACTVQNSVQVLKSDSSDILQNCLILITKAGIYIMFFSILIEFILHFAGNRFSAVLPFLELTTGTVFLLNSSVDSIKRQLLLLALCAFGGLCTAFQSIDAVEHTISLPVYLCLKLLQTVFICFLFYIFCLLSV